MIMDIVHLYHFTQFTGNEVIRILHTTLRKSAERKSRHRKTCRNRYLFSELVACPVLRAGIQTGAAFICNVRLEMLFQDLQRMKITDLEALEARHCK